MKNNHLTAVALPGLLSLLLMTSGCDKNNGKLYIINEPIFASRTSVLASINGNASKSIDSVGKIYVKDNYIFLSVPDQGIHVIDNQNPAHPVQTAFLSIPGNQDIAVKDNILYADMYDALLAIDITDVHHVRVLGQLPSLFTSRTFINGYNIPDGQVIVGWKKTFSKTPYPTSCANCVPTPPIEFLTSSSSPTGIAGSMAKMVLIGNNLYTIPERHSMQIVNVGNPAQLQKGQNIYAGYDLETIYPFKDKLFLGSEEGVYIYDVSNPANPVSSGTFKHGRACDPVITDGNYAYVTLHEGTSCGGAANELDVIDVTDLSNPVPVETIQMTKPMGLSKDGNLLFVCDGPGVKVYDAGTPSALQLRNTLNVGNAYDVISSNQRLVVMSDKGVYQFNYGRPDMPLLSVLSLSSVGRH
jgi:hypothetical protein